MAAVVLVIGSAYLLAPPAFAHSELLTSNPEDGSSLVRPPTTVSLTFDQNIATTFATVTVVGPDGQQWADGKSSVDGPTATVAVRSGAPAGKYTVGYRVISADGHPISGSIEFTATAGSAAAQSQSTTTGSPTQSITAASPTQSITAGSPSQSIQTPAAAEGPREPQGTSIIPVLAAVVAVVAIGAIGVTVVRRRRSTP